MLNDTWIIDLRSERIKRLSKRKKKNKFTLDMVSIETKSGVKFKFIKNLIKPLFYRRIRKQVGRNSYTKI